MIRICGYRELCKWYNFSINLVHIKIQKFKICLQWSCIILSTDFLNFTSNMYFQHIADESTMATVSVKVIGAEPFYHLN